MWTKPAYTEMRFGFEVTMYVMNKQITCTDFQKHKIANNPLRRVFLYFFKKVVDICCSDVIINTVARRCYKGWR